MNYNKRGVEKAEEVHFDKCSQSISSTVLVD